MITIMIEDQSEKGVAVVGVDVDVGGAEGHG